MVGLRPVSAVFTSVHVLLLSGMLAAVVSLAAGFFVSAAISSRLTRQIETLMSSMDRFGNGDMSVSMKVEGRDEIAMLAKRFNQMTQDMSMLMDRVVEEEKVKQQAEYKNLEYEYRFLQWQINPHFIYNAL